MSKQKTDISNARSALTCLYIAVSEDIADNVKSHVSPCLDELESLRSRLETVEGANVKMGVELAELRMRERELKADLQKAREANAELVKALRQIKFHCLTSRDRAKRMPHSHS
jgi:chromosome segregation ATPase